MTSIQKIKGENAHPLYKWISGNVSVIGQQGGTFTNILLAKMVKS